MAWLCSILFSKGHTKLKAELLKCGIILIPGPGLIRYPYKKRMSGKHLEIVHVSGKCPENCNIPDTLLDIFWTFSGKWKCHNIRNIAIFRTCSGHFLMSRTFYVMFSRQFFFIGICGLNEIINSCMIQDYSFISKFVNN